MITKDITQINMLHRIGNAFGWRLEILQNNTAIDLSSYNLEWYVVDIRNNVLLSKTIGDGLRLDVTGTQLIFDTPITELDPLEKTAYGYELRIVDIGGNTPLISGKFKVVSPLHIAAIEAAVTEYDNLIQVLQSFEPTVIQINGNAVFGLELKADLVDGKVPAAQLPSFVDDVLEYSNLAALPATGEASKIYVTLDTNLTYRWTGTAYVQISESTAIWGQISGNIALQTDLQAAFTSMNAAIASKYDNSNPAGYITGINTGMVTGALGYTPYNATNPAGYITGITSGMVTGALGFTPYNATNPANYITTAALAGLVPYTGANAHVQIGANDLITTTGRIGIGTSSFGSGGNLFVLAVQGNIRADRVYANIFRDNVNMNTYLLLTGTTPNQTLTLGNSGISANYFPNGLTGIGISTGVNARLHVQGNSATTGNAVLIQNSTPIELFAIANIGEGDFKASFAPTSGSVAFSSLKFTGTINQTGGANGIVRGINVQQTLTSAVNYRAIEATTGNSSNHTLIKLNNGAQDVFCVRGDGKAGFFGKLAGQASMPGATAGNTYTTAERDMLNAVYATVRDFGLGN